MGQNIIYMDNAATTAVRDEVVQEMLPFLQGAYGNPSSIYKLGREAKKAVDDARDRVAAALGAHSEEIYFTSGGTEANNLAVKGMINQGQGKMHLITSAVEHHAVMDVCQELEKEGLEVTYLPVDQYGMVDPEEVRRAIKPETVLITIMAANNEVGTVQPIEVIGKIAREYGVRFHTDAVQAVGSIPVEVNRINADLLSLSGHKFHGPKGVGALYIRKGLSIQPMWRGGAQERKIRPGTENVHGIVGLGKALELASQEVETKGEKLTQLRDKLIKGLLAEEEVFLNGHPTRRLPGNVNVSIRYVEGESLLLSLDMEGVAASSGSACTSGSLEPSHVLIAMGRDHETAHGSLRFSLGKYNTEEEVDRVLEILPGLIRRLRSMSPVYQGKKG